MINAKIAIIILNWNQEKDTSECLDSLGKVDYHNNDVILVDNGSRDDSPDKLGKRFPKVKMIRNTKNLGFAEGNNIAIREALKTDSQYIMLLNNDTMVEPDFISRLVETAEKDQSIGIVSPKIMFYGERNKIWFIGGRYYPLIKKPFHQFYGQEDRGQIKQPQAVDWVSGCCMLVKREVFEKIGLLDKDYFNNYEDVDFCVRARKAGYKIVIVPQVRIYHKFAAAMGGKFSPMYTYYRTRNNLLYFRKTGQIIPLAFNFVIFPIYSIIMSLVRMDLKSLKATFAGIKDFLEGHYGKGSANV